MTFCYFKKFSSTDIYSLLLFQIFPKTTLIIKKLNFEQFNFNFKKCMNILIKFRIPQ